MLSICLACAKQKVSKIKQILKAPKNQKIAQKKYSKKSRQLLLLSRFYSILSKFSKAINISYAMIYKQVLSIC
jgi:CRISPR/Cas system-associated protein Cas5 (RAMP superfamily)